MARKPGRKHRDSLLNRLKDPQYASQYLSAVLEADGMEGFFEALADVVKAHGPVAVSNESEVSRATLHRMTKPGANPTVTTLVDVLRELELELKIAPAKRKSAACVSAKTTVSKPIIVETVPFFQGVCPLQPSYTPFYAMLTDTEQDAAVAAAM